MLLVHQKQILSEKELVEIKVWQIEDNPAFPDKIKYSMTYAVKTNGKYERMLCYDNEKGKGHHEHRLGRERKIEFKDWMELARRFTDEVEKLRRLIQ